MTVKTIAFFNELIPLGGAETVTLNLARFFHSHGFRVLLYAHKIFEEKLTGEERRMLELRPLPSYEQELYAPVNEEFLCRSLLDEQVDCLIVQAALQLPMAAIRSRTQTKILYCHHSAPRCDVYFFTQLRLWEIPNPTWSGKLEWRLLRKPTFRFSHKLDRRFAPMYAAKAPFMNRFVMLCPEYRDGMQEYIRDYGNAQCEISPEIYKAIPNPLLPVEPSNKDIPKEKIVLYSGRLAHSEKRVDYLLKAWCKIEKHHPDWRLIIAGTGPEEENLQQLAKKLRLKNVEFAGYQTDMTTYYRRATFVCLTSNYEGMPMCLLEGQQYGAIPVAFDSFAGIHTITCNGECGIVVPAYNTSKYAKQLSAAMSDPGLQERMRTRGYEAVRRYDPEVVGRYWLQLFEEL